MFKLTDTSESEFDYTGKAQVAGVKRLKRTKKSEKIKKKPDTSSSSTDGECAPSPQVLAGSRNAPAASSSYFTAHYTGGVPDPLAEPDPFKFFNKMRPTQSLYAAEETLEDANKPEETSPKKPTTKKPKDPVTKPSPNPEAQIEDKEDKEKRTFHDVKSKYQQQEVLKEEKAKEIVKFNADQQPTPSHPLQERNTADKPSKTAQQMPKPAQVAKPTLQGQLPKPTLAADQHKIFAPQNQFQPRPQHRITPPHGHGVNRLQFSPPQLVPHLRVSCKGVDIDSRPLFELLCHFNPAVDLTGNTTENNIAVGIWLLLRHFNSSAEVMDMKRMLQMICGGFDGNQKGGFGGNQIAIEIKENEDLSGGKGPGSAIGRGKGRARGGHQY